MMQRNNASLPIKLALQGGGAHGAFTWGVLDRLLQLPGLTIEAISGTSSGAMNAAALAQGWARGGAAGARESLDAFWQTLSRHNMVPDWWAAASRLASGYWPSATMSRPMAVNPLAPLVEAFFDIALLRQGPIHLHVAATRVRDGAPVVFDRAHLSHDALLASACLPQWFPAVVIDGEAYWDGGFAGNPVLEPLLTESCDDLLCVLLQPLNDPHVPEKASEIVERSAQMAFAGAFRRELRDVALAYQRTRAQLWPHRSERGLKCLRMHMITPEAALSESNGHSAADTRLHQLQALRDLGTQAGDTWLAAHAGALGDHGSFSPDRWLAGE